MSGNSNQAGSGEEEEEKGADESGVGLLKQIKKICEQESKIKGVYPDVKSYLRAIVRTLNALLALKEEMPSVTVDFILFDLGMIIEDIARCCLRAIPGWSEVFPNFFVVVLCNLP